jgi:type II secretory ATPase GspE/PulE/Tfp pilus assembly ATPase PilB-like protein/FixJ family two-component response regulator
MSKFAPLFSPSSLPADASTKAHAAAQTSETAAEAPRRYSCLFVDDEPNVLRALQRMFRQENYEILTAAHAKEALAILASRPVAMVVSDFKMPGMNGADFLRQVRASYPDTIRIMLTGQADTTAVMGAINDGAVYRFILKPWNDDDLRVTVALAFEQYDLMQRNRALVKDNDAKTRELSVLKRLGATNRHQIAIMLHKRGLLTDAQLQELYKLQQARKEPMLRLVLEREWVPEAKIRDILRKDLLIEEVALDEFSVDPAAAALLPRSLCEQQCVLPLKVENRKLLIAVADPMDLGLLDELRFATSLELRPVMADTGAIARKIVEVFGASGDLVDVRELISAVDPFESVEVVIEEDDSPSLEDLLRSTEEPPAVRLVNAIIIEAVRLGASDVHLQPRTKHAVVRLRIDGVVYDKIQFPLSLYPGIVSRIKVMAELDIAERRRPQDGRITVKTPTQIVDLRLSTLPTISGEKVVMRVLDRNANIHRLEALGFSIPNLKKVEYMVSRPQGIVLAVGPTGSGKTTTLYSLIQHEATSTRNYMTVEDPVEYYLDMAGQVHVREKIGLGFATALRAILRQDPDVILLGEIRDQETAEVAFHAALTGHQVFSTLHTNSATATVARLLDLGLKPFVLANALEGIIAQRLVRKICEACREPHAIEPRTRERLGPAFQSLDIAGYSGRGCSACNNSGYKGRLALHEVLVPDDRLRHLISGQAGMLELTTAAREAGTNMLIDDAKEKVAAGLTTADEVLRLLGAQVAV